LWRRRLSINRDKLLLIIMQKFNAISDTPKTNFVRLYLDLADSVVALSHFLDQFIQYGDKVILSVKYFFKTSLTGTSLTGTPMLSSLTRTPMLRIFATIVWSRLLAPITPMMGVKRWVSEAIGS